MSEKARVDSVKVVKRKSGVEVKSRRVARKDYRGGDEVSLESEGMRIDVRREAADRARTSLCLCRKWSVIEEIRRGRGGFGRA